MKFKIVGLCSKAPDVPALPKKFATTPTTCPLVEYPRGTSNLGMMKALCNPNKVEGDLCY